MKFVRNFLVNVVLLAILLAVLYSIAPDLIRGVFRFYSAILGPGLLLCLLLVAALPRGKTRSRR